MTTQGTPGDRKVVLMRILALAEADRLELAPNQAQVEGLVTWFRTRFARVRPGGSRRSRGIEGMGGVTMVGHDDPQEVPGAFQISRFSALASH